MAEDNNLMRLQKYLALAGVASRRRCEELILAGRVHLNGAVVTALGTKVDVQNDEVLLDGKLVSLQQEKRYILLYKPVGYLSSVSDDRGRKTVLDLVRDVSERLYPVGRLDYDTEGLLLLTNDGELTNFLIHPRHEIAKTYEAKVKGIPTLEKIKQLESGILLEDGMTAPAKACLVRTVGKNALVRLTIHEGRNRQVRRMLAAIGYPVLALKRTQIGGLTLGDLQPGQWRFLSAQEIKDLQPKEKKKETETNNG